MRIVEPSVELIDPFHQGDILPHIEKCGRVCYKSEDKITQDSAVKFISGIIRRGHEAVLEHGSYIFRVDMETYLFLVKSVSILMKNGIPCYLRFTGFKDKIVSGNLRAWRDFCKALIAHTTEIPDFLSEFIGNNPVLFGDLSDCQTGYTPHNAVFQRIDPEELSTEQEREVHWDVTAKFVCDRGISHEIVRHRPASYCQESTRYCNYSQDKFSNEISVIKPLYLDEKTPAYRMWKRACSTAEIAYFDLLDWGCTPQEARSVLPTSLKTEVIMTANLREWRHFVALRTAQAAHPQMREVANMLNEKLNNIFGEI